MTQNPIVKVLSTLSCHEVKHLLMGGQACVFYGAVEFSRDCDIVLSADQDNLTRLNRALVDLQAECISIPPLELSYLHRGHAIHFRCGQPEAKGICLDVMSKLRGCDAFESLWERRTEVQDSDGVIYKLIGIEDLVRSKKTQRDRDWPVIRRLVDAHYDQHQEEPTDDRVRFWLRESRTPEVLIRVGAEYPILLREAIKTRPFLVEALAASRSAIQQGLDKEQDAERDDDRQYWQPIVRELQTMGNAQRSKNK